jgi:hypothetical protein
MKTLTQAVFRKSPQTEETGTPPPPDGHEAVIKHRFVLPDRSNPAQHDDRKEDSDKQAEKALIFAPGNENPDAGIIPPEALGEIFGEDVNPEDLDIDETDEDGEEIPEEETKTMRNSTGTWLMPTAARLTR